MRQAAAASVVFVRSCTGGALAQRRGMPLTMRRAGFCGGYSSGVTDELVVRSADRRLQPHVGRYWGNAHRTGAAARQREPLSTGVVLIFGLDLPLGS